METIYLKIDGQILPKILETGDFDNFLFNFLKKNLKKNSVFIDVGANHGFVSKQVSNIKYIKKIITYEPVKEIFTLSRLNLKKILRSPQRYIPLENFGLLKNITKTLKKITLTIHT